MLYAKSLMSGCGTLGLFENDPEPLLQNGKYFISRGNSLLTESEACDSVFSIF
jgi:hypothetical protein